MRKKKFVLAVFMLVALVGASMAPIAAGASIFGGNNSDLGRLFILSKLFSDSDDGILGDSKDGVFSNGNGIDLGNLIILSRLFNQNVFDGQEPVAVAPQPAAQAPATPAPRNLPAEVSGRILLQVEEEGQAWYVNPQDREKYSLGGPSSAFNLMSNVAVGVSNEDFESFGGVAPSELSGRFVIKTEDDGELYYVNPENRGLNYVGGPSDALSLMNSRGLGITNEDLEDIPTAN